MFKEMKVIKLFSAAQGLSAHSGVTTEAYDVGDYSQNGYFAIQYKITGTAGGVGTSVTARYLLYNAQDAHDATVAFIIPSTALSIMTNVGPGSDIVTFTPEMSRFIKIDFNEYGAAGCTLDEAYLIIQ